MSDEIGSENRCTPIQWGWVKNLYLEAKSRGIEFYFHQTGSCFMRNGENIGAWNLNKQIAQAEEIQHELERTY